MKLERCLKAAQLMVSDHSVIHKADFPTRMDFDDAITKLADILQRDDEMFIKAYGRALQSPQGEMLYTAREAARPDQHVYKSASAPIVLSPAEQAIEKAAREYMNENPGVTPAKAMTAVLEADPQLYKDYLHEQARSGGWNG